MGKILTTFSRKAMSEWLTSANTRPFYIGLGKLDDWEVSNTAPTETSIKYDVQKVQDNLVASLKVQDGDFAFLINRNTWVYNDVYDQYDILTDFSDDLENQNYYVINSTNYVYICIFNNRKAPSTVEPSGKSDYTFETADGYRWKFIFEISELNMTTFADSNTIPIISNNAVSYSIIPGTIEAVDVNNGGSEFVAAYSGSIVSAVNSSVYQISSAANTITNFYKDSTIYITTGTGAGNTSLIANSFANGIGNFIKLANAVTLDITSQYEIAPTLTITGDGEGFSGVTSVANGIITGVTVLNAGNNYTWANVTITGSTSYANTSSINIVPLLSPIDGYGADIPEQLNSTKMILVKSLEDVTLDNYLPSNTVYRQISLFNDLKKSNGDYVVDNVVHFNSQFSTNSITFNVGDVIEGSTSSAKGEVKLSNTTMTIVKQYSNNQFVNGEIVSVGNVSTTIANTLPFTDDRKNLDILWYRNENEINRNNDSYELVKLTFNLTTNSV